MSSGTGSHTTVTQKYAQYRASLPASSFSPADGGVIMRSETPDLATAARDLAGLGVRFTIHQPPELREEMRRYAQSLTHDASLDPTAGDMSQCAARTLCYTDHS